MMDYTVQRGDTIANVTRRLGTDWQTLKRLNPQAVGRSRVNGNWFLREGKTVSVQQRFQTVLDTQAKQAARTSPAGVSSSAVPVAGTTFQARGGERLHTVQPGDTVWELGVKRYHVDPDAILQLNNITDPRRLQPGMQLRIPAAEEEGSREVVASWYGEYHHGRPMANGEPYDMYGNTIAHKEMPLGTRVELENPRTGQVVRAIVADRGPYVAGREVDLSFQLARQLSLVEQGVGTVILRVL
ncbi:MAG: septal ring lytic transglycosylase RlpA family protein [Desulfofustis sp.]|jgi:rare lipoprotein A|nr:septal ring lytic transglycosylase RlpA family protein [Desulfofustis sp.]